MSRSLVSDSHEARPSLRADAARNRRRIVDAARAVFAERGVNAPLDEIARRAGVGNATLYRHFPTRDALVAAAFKDRLAEYASAAAEALQSPDPWEGFGRYVERVCAMQAADHGACDVLTMTFPTAGGLEELRDRAFRDFVELGRRAQAAGQLRADFVPEDFVLLLMANAGVVRGTREAAPSAWKRFVGLVLDGCRATSAQPLPPAPTPAQVYRTMRRLSRRGSG
ncbi:MAG: helix-turn-helix domain-containing protein [Sphaerobacter sp.]|nr:helix-turn-helix domain-containing protein [Sphaerobacter sp.]